METLWYSNDLDALIEAGDFTRVNEALLQWGVPAGNPLRGYGIRLLTELIASQGFDLPQAGEPACPRIALAHEFGRGHPGFRLLLGERPDLLRLPRRKRARVGGLSQLPLLLPVCGQTQLGKVPVAIRHSPVHPRACGRLVGTLSVRHGLQNVVGEAL